MEKRRSTRHSAKLFLLILTLVFGPSYWKMEGQSQKDSQWLVTPGEALDLEKGPDEGRYSPSRDVGKELTIETITEDGPTVRVVQPKENTIHSPISVTIRFTQRKLPVNLSSLQVHAQKWVLGSFRGNLDLMPRIMPFVTKKGIDVKDQQMPKGRYRLVLAISDQSGAKTEGRLVFEVN